MILLRHQKFSSPHLTLDENNSTQAQTEPKYDQTTAINLASSTFLESNCEKENSIMLAKIGNLEPITLMSRNAKITIF